MSCVGSQFKPNPSQSLSLKVICKLSNIGSWKKGNDSLGFFSPTSGAHNGTLHASKNMLEAFFLMDVMSSCMLRTMH